MNLFADKEQAFYEKKWITERRTERRTEKLLFKYILSLGIQTNYQISESCNC